MRNIRLIFAREITVRVRKRSFILVTLLAPLFFVGVSIVPSLIMVFGGGSEQVVALVDQTGKFAPYFMQDTGDIIYKEAPDTVGLHSGSLFTEYDALVFVEEEVTEQGRGITLYSKKPLSIDVRKDVEDRMDEGLRDVRIAAYNMPQLDSIITDVRQLRAKVREVTLTSDGQVKRSSSGISFGIAFALVALLSMLIGISSGMVMTGVIEEKNNRVVEILASSVRLMDLMMGKILGIGTVFLIQIGLWFVLSIGLGAVGMGVVASLGGDIASSSAVAPPVGMPGTPDLAQLEALDESPEAATVLADILEMLGGVPWGQILGSFFFYFIFGYLAYAAMYAAAGSAVEDQQDASQLTLPISIPLILGMVCAFYVARVPDGSLAFWLSMIPLTSPVVMPVRCAFGVPFWELAVSGILLISFFVGVTYLASKVYQQGVLRYGRKYTWRDIAEWLGWRKAKHIEEKE